ncbi:VOC family protein [Novosphingobium decolorationis]|uniref:VOC family protein n=1 Tax=Novosphingobium decolorationis TaxID=2698673 RepID=A0ABX8E1Y8_9SPHN|nr:VOC family protein [Novosphingobium decolorationis]QVM83088.1 VOC family protein [Novosphingobium decolorationis]
MTNSLIFFDIPSDDPDAAGKFYAEVFGWEDDPRLGGAYHRMVPGGFFANKDGSESEIGHLHMGIGKVSNMRPHPDPEGIEPRTMSSGGRGPRIWILIDDNDTPERILATAEKLGATVLWRNHYWAEFNGLNHCFVDPWGNHIMLWGKAGNPPKVPEDYTRE